MIILDKQYKIKEICEINSFLNGFVKGVVDLTQELVALDASWISTWRDGHIKS